MKNNTLSTKVQKAIFDKRARRRRVSIICLLAVVIAAAVPWQLRITGVALAGEANCGITAHTHTEECGTVGKTVCGHEEGELVCRTDEHAHTEACLGETGELACALEEHVHSDGCFHAHSVDCFAAEYGCGLEEHRHDAMCYSDKTADVETRSQWERTLPGRLKGEWAADLVSVAESQKGYRESRRNFVLSEDGSAVKGYTRYGAWYGNEYGDWNAMFVSFCLHYAGIPEEAVPYAAGSYAWTAELSELDLLRDRGYTPKRGDLVFFDSDSDASADRVGIVTETGKGRKLSVIEGDIDDAVRTNTYSKSDRAVMCYVSIDDAYSRAVRLGIAGAQDEAAEEEAAAGNEPPAERLQSAESAQDMRGETVVPEETAAVKTAEAALAEKFLYDTELTAADVFLESAELTEAELTDADGYITPEDEDLPQTEVPRSFAAPAVMTAAPTVTAVRTENFPNVKADGTAVPEPSGQIVKQGGTNTALDAAADGDVSVSKTISATGLENVFDIELQVLTGTDISTIESYAPMEVVLVVDISNTMTYRFGGTGSADVDYANCRYRAAASAAKSFLDSFQAEAQSINADRKVGIVAFNTNAIVISELTGCKTPTQRDGLKAKFDTDARRTMWGTLTDPGYAGSYDRFTNMEAGLKLARSMLDSDTSVANENKFIIFVTDGFPTTYVKSGTSGYNPYTTSGTVGADGVFYDQVSKKYCKYGTSYSDEAAIRAEKEAVRIKNSGITIFSIGVDVGGQTIEKYVKAEGPDFSVVQRKTETYAIGSASSAGAFKNWLGSNIGSGFYYDSDNSSGMSSALADIYSRITETVRKSVEASWVAADPINSPNAAGDYIEFVRFTGTNSAGAAVSDMQITGGDGIVASLSSDDTVSWDLKNAVPAVVNGKFLYTLTYRIRLKNENAERTGFESAFDYETNGETGLRYKVIDETHNYVSGDKRIDFTVPQIEGYLSELNFTKRAGSADGEPIADVTFTLEHCCENPCDGGDGFVDIADKTETSSTEGAVSFTAIPSGHTYILTETVPEGFAAERSTYIVNVAYGELTVSPTDGAPDFEWNAAVINYTSYELPKTGGSGTAPYMIFGLLLAAGPVIYEITARKRRLTVDPHDKTIN